MEYQIEEKRVAKPRTKKVHNQLSKTEKSKLWDILDADVGKKKISIGQETDEPLILDSPMTICRLCKAALLMRDDGFPTCTNNECGLICRDVVDYNAEWRFYGADDKSSTDPTRCGNPINPLLQESSLGCKVLYSGNSSYEMRKIGKWTEWQSIPHREKSLYSEFSYITMMAQIAGIPKIIVDDALAIHKDISEQKMFRGCNRDGIKAASIYIACRQNGCIRTSHEIAEMFHLDNASATHGCSLALDILNTVERNGGGEQTNLGVTLPSAFIERYCSKLNIGKEHMMLGKFISSRVEKMNLIPDNTPYSIAAGIIYFVCQFYGLEHSKSDIAIVCKVSEVTISKCCKKLEDRKADLVPARLLATNK